MVRDVNGTLNVNGNHRYCVRCEDGKIFLVIDSVGCHYEVELSAQAAHGFGAVLSSLSELAINQQTKKARV